MATINGSTNNANWTFKLEAYEKSGSVNINNNTSVVRVDVYIGRTSSTSYCGGSFSGSITVNGSSQSYSGSIAYPTYINGGAWYYTGITKDFTVTHNNDGSKTVGVSATWGADFNPTSASASGNLVLTTIPRSSTITATSVYIGETSQLTVTRYSNSFTHTIYYSFGNLNGYILADGSTSSTATKISATSIGFPIPTTWFEQIPNAKQGTCTLTITTYNGNTQISSAKTSTFVARVDSSVSSPIVTSTVEDTNATTLALTGNSNVLVKGFSTAKVTWLATAKDSSTLSNVKINGTIVTTSPYSFTLNDSDINVVATDSRGLATTSNPNFTLKDYNAPLMTMTLNRVAPTSSYAKISFSGSWFNDSFGNVQNSVTISWKYKKSSDSIWTSGGTLVNNTDYKVNNNTFYSGTSTSATDIQIGGSLAYAYGWDIALTVTDQLNEITIIGSITKGIPVINWGEDFLNVNGVIKKNNVSIGLTKLWENSNPTSAFASQTIILDSDDYDYLIWIFKHARSVNRQKSVMSLKGYSAIFDLAWDYGANNNWYFAEHYRATNRIDDTNYSVGDCGIRYNSWTNYITDNNYLIPVAIYGGKF